MIKKLLSLPPWLPELIEEVRQALAERASHRSDCRPNLARERSELEAQIQGWKQSLGNTKLADVLREAIEVDCAAALERKNEIEVLLAEQNAQDTKTEDLIDPAQIQERVDRLAEVLAANNPTRGNLELSLYIDRIECLPDGKVTVRMCKLGLAPDAVLLLANIPYTADGAKSKANGKHVPRRRNKLNACNAEEDSHELDALNYYATDPNRFAGLDERFFWTDTLQIPEKGLPWFKEHAEEVFKLRQAQKLSYESLGRVFNKSDPTMRAACDYYLNTHPGAIDEVKLSAGNSGTKRIDVGPIAHEVRKFWWEDGWSKLQLAVKFNVASTTIDRALKLAYAKTGEKVPTQEERQQNQMRRAHELLEASESVDNIARILHTSDVSVRKLLRQSFAAKGLPMPDLRRRRRQAG